jgi:N-acetylneuraminate lyase
MNMQPLSGIITALLTPFDDAERIDEGAVSALIDFQVRQGVQGLYVGGSTGEALLQSLAEREHFLKLVAQANTGRLRLIAHVGAIATADVLFLSERAAAYGYDAISAIPPFYYSFSTAEVTAHYHEIARQSALPLIIYNFPAGTKGFSTGELIDLLSTPRIIGVKHTSTDMFSLERVLRHRPQAIIFNGYDEMCLAGLAMGAQGAIGTTYNFMGDLFVDMARLVKAGKLDQARSHQRLANDIIDQLIRFGVIPATKAILESFGLRMGTARRPFRTLAAEDKRSLADAVLPLLAWRTGSKAA